MEKLIINSIPSSFVYRKMKTISDKGSGEGKLFIGPISKITEFDNFFEFDSVYEYKLDKQNLLEYMHEVKIEYVYQFFNKYQEANMKNWEDYYEKIQNFSDDDLLIKLVKQVDSTRYYIDQEKKDETDKLIFKNFIRRIIVPKLTNIIFEKDSRNKTITLRLLVSYEYQKRIDSIKQNEIISFPHNRIIFGAPGTGKSHLLCEDQKKYFPCIKQIQTRDEYIEKKIKKEISQKPDSKNLGDWAAAVAIKYSQYFNRLENWFDTTKPGGSYVDFLSKTFELNAKQPELMISAYRGINILNKSNDDYALWERVTFHPNYSYAQFVGTYKPTMSEPNKKLLSDEQQHILSILQDANMTSQEKYDLLYEDFKDGDLTRLPILLGLFTEDNFKTKKADGTPAVGDNSVERNHGKAIRPYVNLPVQDSSDEKQITYQYVPGPFMRIYAAAKQNPNNNYLLLIEEINRANVAALFGDVFQLLDRNSNGESEYKVAASEDIKKYLAKKGIYEDELSIPSNMYIWATMNSADQGVFPMDTAFKRRWEFEYIGIDDNEDKVKDYEIPINSNQKVNWNELRKAINTRLIEMSINEDKLLGPFFLSKTVLENASDNPEKFVKLFKSKVIMYLFEDAAKMKVKQLFKIDNNKYIFSEICKQFDEKGLDVFQIDTSNIKLSEIDNTKEDVVVSEGNIDTPSLFE